MPIYELDLKDLGPFDEVHFEFDPKINVFVGPNNCGKSTAQMALGDIAVYPFNVPEKLLRSEKAEFRVCKGATRAKAKTYAGQFPISTGIKYWTRHKFDAWTPTLKELGFSCIIPALRRSSDYRAEGAVAAMKKKEESGLVYTVIPSRPNTKRPREVVDEPPDLAKRRALFEPSASAVGDAALIQKMIDLDYRAYREKNPAVRAILDKIGSIASEITNGFPVAFSGVAEDKEGLYPEFKTPDGKVPLNVLSQGTQSVIQWLGLLLIAYAQYYDFPKKLENKPGVAIIDEIDAHMHPSWQQRILPALSRNFPRLQIFCSAHSPLVLAGLKAGQAHLLKRDSKGKVVVSCNQSDIVGWSTDEILRNFLDIANPTDLQTSDSIDRLQQLRRKRRLGRTEKQELEHLRGRVSQRLHAGPVGSEIEQFVQFMKEPPAASRASRTSQTSEKATKVLTRRKRAVKSSGKKATRVLAKRKRAVKSTGRGKQN